MKGVIKVINFIKAHPKTEGLFKVCCQDMDQDYVRLVLHTQVRLLSKGNCLGRFVALYDTVLEFESEREVFQFLKSNDTKALICYLADVYGKLNGLNTVLQCAQKTLMDCKTKICAFITELTWRSQIARHNICQFPHLGQCEPSDKALRIITGHLAKLSQELNGRYTDLKSMTFPAWITQPFLFDCGSEECLAMDPDQVEDGMKPIHAVRNEMMWLDSQVSAKYSKLAVVTQQALLPFLTTYLIECAFSSVTYILTKKRGRLDITGRGDLRSKLTCFVPRISNLVARHQAQGSHLVFSISVRCLIIFLSDEVPWCTLN